MLYSQHEKVSFKKNFQNTFDWSLRPLIDLVKFFGGINLMRTSPASKSNEVMKTVLFTAWAAFLMVSNIAVNGSRVQSFISIWQVADDNSDSPWISFFWNPHALLQHTRYYSALSFFYFIPAIHFIFLFVVLLSPRWRTLIKTFQDIHCRMKLTECFYRKCRRICSFFILILVLDFSTFVHEYGSDPTGTDREVTDGMYWPSYTIFYANEQDNAETKKEIVIATCGFYLALWARLIEIGVRTTFCTFALLCTLSYEELKNQMKEMVENENEVNNSKESLNEELEDHMEEIQINEEIMKKRQELENWKNDYETIRRLVENVNYSFGLVLLLFICHDFAISIFKFHNILTCLDKAERVCAFSHQLFRLFILLSSSNQVDKKALGPGMDMLQLPMAISHRKGFSFSHQLNTILLQISEIPVPNITALEIFEVNLKILFTWLDIAIQYGVIVYSAYQVNEAVRETNLKLNFVSPCVSQEFGTIILCSNISIWEVRTAFHNANDSHFSPAIVALAPIADDREEPTINIPEDLFGIHCISGTVEIDCSTHRLSVHQGAFRWSASCLHWLRIKNCDLSSIDFGFLSNFELLVWLEFEYCERVSRWSSTVHLLPNLAGLTIESSDLNDWIKFPRITGKLICVNLMNNSIGNVAMDRILRWLSSFSAESLIELLISYNNLTRIPQPLTLFTALNTLDMKSQTAPGLGSLPTGALNFSSPVVERLDLKDCGITHIMSGAIQGDCVGEVNLVGNNISLFEETVFLGILILTTRCEDRRSLLLSINTNTCYLAWLIRDNRDLIVHVDGVQCTNGTMVRDLDPMGLSYCLPIHPSRNGTG